MLGERGVEGDDVGAGQELVELDLLDVEVARTGLGEVGVVGDDPHLQPLRAVGDDRADIAAADQAQGLAHELDAHEAGLLPFAGPGRAVGRGDLAAQGQHQRDRVLGRGDRVAEGRVHHHDPALGGGVDVDIVDADPGAADDLEAGGYGQHLGRDLGRGAHGEPVIVADNGDQLVLLQAGADLGLDPALGEDA